MKKPLVAVVVALLTTLLGAGCASKVTWPNLPTSTAYQPSTSNPADYTYVIGPGDELQVFVWNNPELSTRVVVRPDGKVTTPLAEDVVASGKTSSELAKLLEQRISEYVREPIVSVILNSFAGPQSEQVRVLGETVRPLALPYRENMTLLDVMVAVGGLTDFADGNRATVVRVVNGRMQQFSIRLDDLVRRGDISANVDILPGDTLIVPEAWF